MISDLDDLLVERVAQPLAKWVERRTGVGNFAGALLCTNLALVLYAPILAWVVKVEIASWSLEDFTVAPAYVLNLLIPVAVLGAMWPKIGDDIDLAARAIRSGRKPSAKRRFETRLERAFTILGTLVPAAILSQVMPTWTTVLTGLAAALAAVGVYLRACPPMVPSNEAQRHILALLRFTRP